jgi:NCS1 family nucleobase:cation symporter-1
MLTATIGAARTFAWCTAASDFTRYLPRRVPAGRVRLAAGLGAGAAGLWMYLIGAAVGTAVSPTSPADLVTLTVPPWLAGVVLAAVLLASLVASAVDVYAASLDLLVVGLRLGRWQAAVMVGALGGLTGWAAGRHEGRVFADFQSFLVAMSYWLGPWIAIVLVDYFLVRRGRLDLALCYDRRRRFAAGLPALVCGVAAALPFVRTPLFTGPAAGAFPVIGDIAYWVGGLVAGGLYWWWSRPAGRQDPSGATA